jgi:glutamine amidotransferase
MSVRAIIVAAGGANYGSLREACRRIGVEAEVSDDAARIRAATHVVLPGVGAAAQAMQTLRARGLDRVLAKLGQPLLGICLGMQLLFEHSSEGDTECLGMLPGHVRRLPPAPRWPHMGWNTLRAHVRHPLLASLECDAWFYFVHGYAAQADAGTIATTDHGGAFAALVARGNVHGVQFHPEKSAVAGRRLLQNFFSLA